MTNPSPDSEKKRPTRLPAWLRRPLPTKRDYFATESLLEDLRLSTVCQGARCPNIHECFSCGTATFLILGNTCTRNCAFCNIAPGRPEAPDPDEPARVARAAARLALRHTVVTSVSRDDLPDGGAAHFAAVIHALRETVPQSSVEVLIPDFQGDAAALACVIAAGPDIINHNVESHPALYARIRPQAEYARSLELLGRVCAAKLPAKSGFMVGLGEDDEQVRELLRDLQEIGCSMVTVGQYLRPSAAHPPVERYVTPEQFEEYARYGKEIGIAHVFSAPLVRSSYQAAEANER
ncbi:lipoyl synthase [Desulfovibrio sp. OttesenSCG-928-M16]|nr:lipoyl synthase [Desulfovibrio sp. OttesenSCG-928-M16]